MEKPIGVIIVLIIAIVLIIVVLITFMPMITSGGEDIEKTGVDVDSVDLAQCLLKCEAAKVSNDCDDFNADCEDVIECSACPSE